MLAPQTIPTRSRRRSAASARGADTRRRLIETAIEVFAAHGYDGTSTRLLAERAGVNLPAIQYHFGSKEGLYRAVVGYFADYIERQMAPIGGRVRAALASGKPSHAATLALLTELLENFVALIFEGGDGDTRASVESRKLFIARAELERSAALGSLYATMRRCVGEPCAALVARLIGRSLNDEQTWLRATAVLGQAAVFCNKPAAHTLRWKSVNGTRVRAVQRIVCEQTRAIFAEPGR
ncbi:MAG: CerR family C-terminal domain-containing protein [Alphaproteobacteria bacterium]|nr:CerR family C-terminal domain-containing protein [Alphaproteobacteria bacterium]